MPKTPVKELADTNAKNAVLIEEMEERIRDMASDMLNLDDSIEHLNAEIERANRLIDKLETVIDARLVMLAPSTEEISQHHQKETICGSENEPPVYITEEVKLLRHLDELIRNNTQWNFRLDEHSRKMRDSVDSMGYGKHLFE